MLNRSDLDYGQTLLNRKLLLSVVTISRNDPSGLRKTIESLYAISHESIQLIIVDGSDSDSPGFSSLDLSEFRNVHVIRENDDGIYDAMNKGLSHANGKFVWFLNGGDVNLLTSTEFLFEYISEEPLPVLLGCYRVGNQKISIKRKPSRITKIKHGLPTSHQAILYPCDIFKKIGFDLRYRMCADYASLAVLHVAGQKFQNLNQEIAEFNLDGYSGQNQPLLRTEAKDIQKNILRLPVYYIFFSQMRHRFSARVRNLFNMIWGLR